SYLISSSQVRGGWRVVVAVVSAARRQHTPPSPPPRHAGQCAQVARCTGRGLPPARFGEKIKLQEKIM
ncbi:unnamed protein product, partial [Urochloa humidicola]